MLNLLIQSLSKEDVRHLKLVLNRTNAQKDRKDIQLFDYIRKSGTGYEEEKILGKLYGKEGKNSFYRLKNRLMEDIGKSITLQYYNTYEVNQTLYHIALSRLFQSKNHFKLAHYYLRKAEKKADQIHNYELLDMIYTDFIRFSQESLVINPETYIEKRKKNEKKFNRLRKIDDILAVFIYRIRLSQNYSSGDYAITDLLQKTIDEFSVSADISNSPQLRFKIYHALSRILLQQRDYVSLETYLLQTFEEFTKEDLFSKTNHDTKLQMLTYLVNAFFKNKKYKEALEHTERLKSAMQEYNGLLHDKYVFYYYNALIICYSVVDGKKAGAILQEALANNEIRKVVPHSNIIFRLNLALRYFEDGEFKLAKKEIVKLKLDDIYENLDSAFRLKINVVELIIRYESGDHDFVDHQVEVVKKEFAELLEGNEYERQYEMLDLIGRLIFTTARVKTNEELKNQIKNFISKMPDEEASDNDILNYNEWLKRKME